MFKQTMVIALVTAAAISVGGVLAAASGAGSTPEAAHAQVGTDQPGSRGAVRPGSSAERTDLWQHGADTPAPAFATMTDWLRLLAHDPFYHSFVGGMPGSWTQ